MLIDFHTHVFPEKIAAKTLAILQNGILKQEGARIEPCYNGTPDGLHDLMNDTGVDISVTMPIVTNPDSTDSINKYAKEITNGRIISFAGIHPMLANCEDKLKEIAEQGFIGIKIHPEFQSFYIDSKESVALFKAAEKLGIYITLHAGEDIGLPPPVHATPQRLKNVLSEVSGKYIIAAHMGGFREWDDVEKYLVGTDIYMDTAFVKDFLDVGQCRRMIINHGADKILFGSDAPWENPTDTLKYIKSLDLSDNDLEKITHKNAEKILKL